MKEYVLLQLYLDSYSLANSHKDIEDLQSYLKLNVGPFLSTLVQFYSIKLILNR
jgi:hypothetical protein